MKLTIEKANELIGKTIKWTAPAYELNNDYNGECVIEDVDSLKRNPLTVRTMTGDHLGYAFIDNKNELAFSDNDRHITILN